MVDVDVDSECAVNREIDFFFPPPRTLFFFFSLLTFFLSDRLQSKPKSENAFTRCVGWLAAYLFCLTGHRTGVLTSLGHHDVVLAEKNEDCSQFVINVSDATCLVHSIFLSPSTATAWVGGLL